MYKKVARSSGRKACRHWRIRPLGGSSQNQTAPAYVLKPQALICSQYQVCAHVYVHYCVVAHVHIYGVFVRACILQCVFIYSIYTSVSMCSHICVCMSVYVWASFKLRVFNSSKCGCVFIHTDAVW